MTVLNGLDVSGWQPASIGNMVDYDFIITKATEGTGFVNSSCEPVVQSAKRRDKCWGTYHFARMGNSLVQADYYLKHTEGYIGSGIMALDYEGAALHQGYGWAFQFCQRVIEITGIPPLVYASLSQVKSLGLARLSLELNCGLWVAAYPNSRFQGYSQPPSPLAGVALYQYASTGRLPGYAGNLDLNVFYGDSAAWQAYASGGRAPKTVAEVMAETLATEPAETLVEEMAELEMAAASEASPIVESAKNAAKQKAAIWRNKLRQQDGG